MQVRACRKAEHAQCSPCSAWRFVSGSATLLSMQDYPKHYCGVFGVYRSSERRRTDLLRPLRPATSRPGKRRHRHVATANNSAITKAWGWCRRFSTATSCTIWSATWPSATRAIPPPVRRILRNAQPLTVDCARGQIAIAHNGNLTNAAQLRENSKRNGSIFQTTVDSEIILHLMAQPTLDGHDNNLVQTDAPDRRRLFAGHHDRDRN